MADIDNFELDLSNIEFNYALDFVKHTDKFIYLTGRAGTGKTTFLKYLKSITSKNTAIIAPTGVAAINAGGQTIHSFFQIKPSIYVPDDKRLRVSAPTDDPDKTVIFDHFKYAKPRLDLIRKLELLIIDEISMVRCDLLDVIDKLLRVFRMRENEAFGGVQVVIIGDTFQLPPIVDIEEQRILSEFYESPYFFSSNVVMKNKPVYIELKKIYRQNEQEFIDLLNKIRVNDVGVSELDLLNSRYNPLFYPPENSSYITLATHNKIVEETNLTKLAELSSDIKSFTASVDGIFPDNALPTDKVLKLKVGAQVMFIRNDKGKRFYNGKIGRVCGIEFDSVQVEFPNGERISVGREEWNNIRYKWNSETRKVEEESLGTFHQFPLRLAWAITVHKSQGLTFSNVIADLSLAFSPGQVYVALSRCTTLDGLVLKTKIGRDAIKTDPVAFEFSEKEMSRCMIEKELSIAKLEFSKKNDLRALLGVKPEVKKSDGQMKLG